MNIEYCHENFHGIIILLSHQSATVHIVNYSLKSNNNDVPTWLRVYFITYEIKNENKNIYIICIA